MAKVGQTNAVMTPDGRNTPPPAAEQQSKAANSGGERLLGLIAFIAGFPVLWLGLPINSSGSWFLISVGIGLIAVGFVFMIFGRWAHSFFHEL